MPTPAYMFIEGETQGVITEGCNTPESIGNDFQSEHENEFMVQAFEHKVYKPYSPQHGQPTGPREHGPLDVTKVFDQSSPLLYTAMVTGERLPECVITWYRTDTDGTETAYFTHTLTDALIVSIEAYMPNCQDPNLKHFTHLEKVSLTFRKIKWTHTDGSTEGEDDWREPQQEVEAPG